MKVKIFSPELFLLHMLKRQEISWEKTYGFF